MDDNIKIEKHDNIKIEKHDHPTWKTISKLKNNVFKYNRLAANAKKHASTITYYNDICL